MSFITNSPHRATEEAVRAHVPPARTKTWDPIAHCDVIDMVVEKVTEQGFDIVEANYSLTDASFQGEKIEGSNMFGEMILRGGEGDEVRKVVGLRNSVSQSFPAGLCMGDQVTVCDNMCFAAELMVLHKHTSQIRQKLPRMFKTAMDSYLESFQHRQEQIRNWKGIEIDQRLADHVIMEGRRRGALIAANMMPVLKEFENPRHDDFKDPTVWSFSNAYTEVQKTRTAPPKQIADETIKMTELLGELFPTAALN